MSDDLSPNHVTVMNGTKNYPSVPSVLSSNWLTRGMLYP